MTKTVAPAPRPPLFATLLQGLHPAWSLPTRYATAGALVFLLAFGLGWQAVKSHLQGELEAHLDFYGRSLARQAALAAAPKVLADDRTGLADQLDSLLLDKHVQEAVVYGKDGQILAQRPAGDRAPTSRTATPFVETITSAGQRAGFLRLNLNADELAAASRMTLLRLGLAAALLGLLATMAIWWGMRRLSLSLGSAQARLEALVEGRLEWVEKPGRAAHGETGRLMQTSEQLRQHLLARSRTERQLTRFAPSPLTQCLRQDESGDWASGRYVGATLLLVEFVNLGPLSERLAPEALAELLNTYHSLLARACKLYNGQIDKYYGDGVLVLFGLPRQDEEHAFHALCAALLFHQLALRFGETRGPDQSLQLRLSLHTGGLLAAILGAEQAQFTVLGDALNLVMRLVTVAGNDEIVLSRELAELPELRQRVATVAHRNVLIKGRTEPTPTYRLAGLTAPYDELLAGQVQHLLGQLSLA